MTARSTKRVAYEPKVISSGTVRGAIVDRNESGFRHMHSA
ncbi:hypothetical protein BRPE64_ECDS02700 (plasmid) [Caballeronia insecticola]|uniref:Uncharacterized protein n=1 Tax=Caballeronia insecticola TaxID=758793 RepID=A0A060PH92_9BURK|nr:hypothetical protein BRPE64_ECDS02700 [Caballeronia insecticola]